MILDPDTRLRIAKWGIVAAFVILLTISAFAAEIWGPGFLRHGLFALMMVVAAFFLVFPTAVALLIFAAARGPAMAALAGLSALIGVGWSALGAWEIFSSHSSTAGIGIIFLPALQLFLLVVIAFVGLALDALVRLALRKAAK